jgi:hypothetical protein
VISFGDELVVFEAEKPVSEWSNKEQEYILRLVGESQGESNENIGTHVFLFAATVTPHL